ncbi:MAG TPA: CotH kinase family protein [Polyangiaceae bacterium]|nr:CotH kinase family protein [Polyangiaceae bacterium]
MAGAAFALMLGCGDDPQAEPAPGVLATGDPYDLERLLEIEIEMPGADWDALREQGFSLFEFQRGQAGDFDYTFFDADIRVDGQLLERASVRKKGGLGSLSRLRPSLIVDFDRNVADREVLGVSRLTLNNDRSSPSHNRQCMAYELFAQAGLPASRCNLAHVVVNGEDLGTFSNVEPVRKPLLRRLFGDDSGNLYEGREDGDFTPDGVERFQIKTNEKTNDRSDLRAVLSALQADDASVVAELERVVDLDQFRRFWAIETLTGNWDSYSGNTNNFYLYHDPSSDRFVFLPWGTDTAFTGGSIIDAYNQTLTVYATGALANRLYNLPAERERFRALLAELNDTLWDAGALEARLDALAERSTDAWPGAVAAQRAFLRTHSDALRAELAQPAPEWIVGGIDQVLPCRGTTSRVSGEFDTLFTVGGLQPSFEVEGSFQAEAALVGAAPDALWIGVAGRDPNAADPSGSVQLVGILPDERSLFIGLQLPASAFAPGVHPLYNFESVGFAAYTSAAQPSGAFLGFVSEGAVEFDAAGLGDGARVAGRFEGELFQTRCLE